MESKSRGTVGVVGTTLALEPGRTEVEASFATSSGQRTIQSSLTLLSFYRVGVIILYEAVVKVEENAFKAPHRTSPAYGGCSIKDEINTFWVTLDKLLNRFMPCFTCL